MSPQAKSTLIRDVDRLAPAEAREHLRHAGHGEDRIDVVIEDGAPGHPGKRPLLRILDEGAPPLLLDGDEAGDPVAAVAAEDHAHDAVAARGGGRVEERVER